jgi:hypothetical protein
VTRRYGDSDKAVYQYIEYMYVTIYTIELALRVIVGGWNAFKSSWTCFDAFLLLSSYFNLAVQFMVEQETTAVTALMLLRNGRLLRLVRTVRLIAQFQVFYMLVRGLLGSAKPVFFAVILIFGFLYVLSIFCVELITIPAYRNPEAQTDELLANVDTYYYDLPSSICTLAAFIFKIHYAYAPVILDKPYMTLLMAPIMVVLVLALMNLVTGVIVNRAIEMSNMDKELQLQHSMDMRRAMIPKLRALFEIMDVDGSHELSLEEVQKAPEDVRKSLMEIVKSDDYKHLFDMIDQDESGSIDIDEFVEGLLRLVEGNKVNIAKEFLLVEKRLAVILRKCTDTWELLKAGPSGEITVSVQERKTDEQEEATNGRGGDVMPLLESILKQQATSEKTQLELMKQQQEILSRLGRLESKLEDTKA